MNQLEIQVASDSKALPDKSQFQNWVDTVLIDPDENTEIVIRIVDETESASLNQQYRHKNGATNVLSFPFEAPEHISTFLLGDLVICAPVIEQQAIDQQKPLDHHWAHIVIHGVLHLCGYDHLDETEAEEMEAKEIAFLKKLTISNPYQEKNTHE
ncbi:MAG: rRNA maturation RNase YbeY [Methylococcaceae bacterium]|nr:rRNA maturation RNase YbeY [Methylococcaceae bacterium]